MRESGDPEAAQDTIMMFHQYMMAGAAVRNRAE
jgi:hypothetical protein